MFDDFFSPIVGLFLLAGLGILLFSAMKIVPQGEEWTLEKWGQFKRILHPGLHVIIPFMYRIGKKVNIREQVLDIPPQDVITKDNAMIRVDGIVYFCVFDAEKAAYKITDLDIALQQLVTATIRMVFGGMELDQALSDREKSKQKIQLISDEGTDKWGIKVYSVHIKDIHPPKDQLDTMGKQMKAEREKRASILQAEAEKDTRILNAEGKKKSAIAEAEGMKQAQILAAEGEVTARLLQAEAQAKAREMEAQAEANAIQLVSEALAKGDSQAMMYFLKQKQLAALPEMTKSPNSKTIFMPIETTQLLSGLGSLVELAAATMPSNPPPKKL